MKITYRTMASRTKGLFHSFLSACQNVTGKRKTGSTLKITTEKPSKFASLPAISSFGDEDSTMAEDGVDEAKTKGEGAKKEGKGITRTDGRGDNRSRSSCNLPTGSHGSSDKHRLTSQLDQQKQKSLKRKHEKLTINFIFDIQPLIMILLKEWTVFIRSVNRLPHPPSEFE